MYGSDKKIIHIPHGEEAGASAETLEHDGYAYEIKQCKKRTAEYPDVKPVLNIHLHGKAPYDGINKARRYKSVDKQLHRVS